MCRPFGRLSSGIPGLAVRLLPSFLPVLVVLSPLAAGGCSSFGSQSDPPGNTSTPTTSGRDAGSSSADGGVDMPPPDGADAGNGTFAPFREEFETGSICSPWSAIRGSLLTTAGGAENTDKSCKACTTNEGGGGAHRTIRPQAPATELPAGTYTFTVWIRSEAYTGKVAFELYERKADDGKGEYRKGAQPNLSPTWTPIQVAFSTPTPVPGWYLDLYQYNEETDGSPPPSLKDTCFQLDEFAVDYDPKL